MFGTVSQCCNATSILDGIIVIMGEHQKIWTFGLITAVVRLDDTDCNTTPEVKGGAKKYLSQKEGEIELANCLIFAIW